MKIKLVFGEWKRRGQTINPDEELILSKGDFHGGSTFRGTIHLDPEQEKELREAIVKGYQPVFWVF